MLCEIWYISYEINPQVTCATISIVTQYIVYAIILHYIIVMLEDGARIKMYTNKNKQIEILYSVNTRQHARNKCVHLCAYRYQVLYVL